MFIYSVCLILLTCVLPAFLGFFHHRSLRCACAHCTRAVMPFWSDVSAVGLAWAQISTGVGVALCCSARQNRGHL